MKKVFNAKALPCLYLLFACALLGSTLGLTAQTTFNLTSAATYSGGSVLTFLTTATGTSNNGAPYTINIAPGVVLTINNANFDLTTLSGNVTLNVQGNDVNGGEIFWDGGSGATLTMNAGDVLAINPGNTDGLDASSAGQPRIITDGTDYPGNQFASLIAAGGVNGSGNPLPVELTMFRATLSGMAVILEWETQSETNNAAFIVEHSLDGRTFQTVGEVAGRGNSETVSGYQFAHEGFKPGVNYYRLRQVDFDGTSELSQVQVLTVSGLSGLELRFIGTKDLSISFVEETQHVTTVTVLDAQGRVLSKATFEAGQRLLNVGMPSLGAGWYTLNVRQGGLQVSHAFVR